MTTQRLRIHFFPKCETKLRTFCRAHVSVALVAMTTNSSGNNTNENRSPVVPTHLDKVNWTVQLNLGAFLVVLWIFSSLYLGNDNMHKILEPSGVLNFELVGSKGEKVCRIVGEWCSVVWYIIITFLFPRNPLFPWNSITPNYTTFSIS
jgi:hypothetical protein